MSQRSFLLICIALPLAYSLGVNGPFVLDDHVNLLPVWLWWAGHTDLVAIFANPSGPLGRPLAMSTFVLNAAVGGQNASGFKLFNLALHLINAGLVYLLLLRVLATARFATCTALAIAALWALHPQHVGTVLYVVQRMALLGAMAQLGAVLVYVEARTTQARDPRRANLLLFVAFPALLLLGLLGKETAILAPLLCGALEVSLLAALPRPAAVRKFFLAFVALPTLLAVALMVFFPERLFAAYAGREFDLTTRFLTQPRILLDYAQGWFWPLANNLGLYRDGYPLSQSLVQPLSTAIAVALWTVVAVLAWCVRRRNALASGGIFWFLAAHALESSVLPLEPYFEHRNYVASLGLLLAAFGTLRQPLARLSPATLRAGVVIVLLALFTLTALRAHRWGDLDRLLASEAPPPGEISRRLQVDRAIRGFEIHDIAASNAALDRLATGSRGDRAAAALWRAILQCDREGHVAAVDLDRLRDNPPTVLTHSHVSWLELLGARADGARCAGLGAHDVEDILQTWQRAAVKPPTAANRARLEVLHTRLQALTTEASP